MSVVTSMDLTYCLLLCFSLANLSSAARQVKAGCNLEVPDDVKKQMEPPGPKWRDPLSISMDMKVLGVRDVPDSGGSYGVDIG